MDSRAQSIGIVRFFAALIVGAVLAFFVNKVTAPILSRAQAQGSGTAASNATQWLTTANEYLVVIFLLISFFGIVVLSLYQRRVRG